MWILADIIDTSTIAKDIDSVADTGHVSIETRTISMDTDDVSILLWILILLLWIRLVLLSKLVL